MDFLSLASDTEFEIPTAGLLVYLAVIVLVIAANWKIFTKAKQPGWAAIVPIYNFIVLMRVIGRPWWWIFLMLVPIVNWIIGIVTSNDLSKSFGKGVGYTLLLIFLPFIGYPLLAWGDAKYQGPAAK